MAGIGYFSSELGIRKRYKQPFATQKSDKQPLSTHQSPRKSLTTKRVYTRVIEKESQKEMSVLKSQV
jgi:hypothetical protein